MKTLKIKKTLSVAALEKMFGERLSPYVKAKIRGYDFKYEELAPEDRDGVIKKIVETLLDPSVVHSGTHRLQQWEKGWGQNLEEFLKNPERGSILPHYHGKYEVVRINQRFVRTVSKNFERNSLYIIQDWLFDKYLRKAETVYEFGCGTGHNLFHAREVNPKAALWGLDWAASSQKILAKLRESGVDKNLFGRHFDFFHPDDSFKLDKDSAVYTVAALEQVGKDFEKFLDYLIGNKPKICIHIEPVAELLDQNNLLDYLSIKYFQKRRYLSGFLTRLRALEKKGRLKIMSAKRNFIGSLFIEGYSVIVWKPL